MKKQKRWANARTIMRLLLGRLRGDVSPRWRVRVVLDDAIAVGLLRPGLGGYPVALDKEKISRDYILDYVPSNASGQRLRFLDVGGRDGLLTYLLGYVGPLQYDQATYERNKRRFDATYDYFGIDLQPAGPNILCGNVCDHEFLDRYKEFIGSFDVIYSNNVFEHFDKPWIAAEVLFALLKPGGLCLTIVPFAQRYHESPGDYFRYTHTGIGKLFQAVGLVRILEAGYDIRARRYDWQGHGEANDIVPVDRFGAWRETWFAVSVVEKSTTPGVAGEGPAGSFPRRMGGRREPSKLQ